MYNHRHYSVAKGKKNREKKTLMLTGEARKLSNLVPALIGLTRKSHQLGQQFACGATEDSRS